MSNQINPLEELKKLVAKGGIIKLIKQFLVPFIIICSIAIIALYRSFFADVGPNQFGIKVKQIGLNAGVQKDVYETGLHFIIPTIQTMEILPKDLQILELSNDHYRYQRMRNVTVARAAHIQTSDGFYVDVDCSIIYKIIDPYLVITKLGKNGIYQNSILPKVEPSLKRTLGKLTTEEFYNSHLRVEKMIEAKKILSAEFAINGLEVVDILIRYFKYSDEIQKNIEEKKLKDQLVFKNKAEAKASLQGAKLKKVTEEGEAFLSIKLAEGQAYRTTRNAEMENYVRIKKAEANLLVKLAEAEKTRLMNTALRAGGADKMVGLEMAKVLSGIDTIILPSDGKNGLNPLDINKTLKMFEIR